MMQIYQNKTKSIAWFVSNCHAFNKRLDLVKKLQTLIDVDIYGKCGTLKCNEMECNHLLTSTYKFYLSFENSLCIDYVSEKFFRPLEEYNIPIVYNGVKNNSNFGPPKSFIDANNFETIEALVDYLKYLIDNPREYIKYFWWKKHYRVKTHNNYLYAFCNLCQKLNDENFMSQKLQYDDMHSWYNEDKCDQNYGLKI